MGSVRTEREALRARERAALEKRVCRYIQHGMRLAHIMRATGLSDDKIKRIAAAANLKINNGRVFQ